MMLLLNILQGLKYSLHRSLVGIGILLSIFRCKQTDSLLFDFVGIAKLLGWLINVFVAQIGMESAYLHR